MGKVVVFWVRVCLRSIDATWKFIREHVVTALILLISLVLASYFSANGIIDQAIVQGYLNDVSSSARFLTGLSLIAFVWFLINIAYQPAKMYDELGGLDKMNLRLVVECQPPRYSEAWISLAVHNDHAIKPISSCYTYLKSVVFEQDGTSALKRAGEKLAWSSHNHPLYGDKEIPPNESRLADVIRTIHSENRIMFTIQDMNDLYKDKAYSGTYIVTVGVVGIFAGKRFDEAKTFKVTYSGDMRLSCDAA